MEVCVGACAILQCLHNVPMDARFEWMLGRVLQVGQSAAEEGDAAEQLSQSISAVSGAGTMIPVAKFAKGDKVRQHP